MQSDRRTALLNVLLVLTLLVSAFGGVVAPTTAFAVAPQTVAARPSMDHTTNPAGVAVVGDLQDELGCPGDWQPECANTKMAYSADFDLWTFSADLPAGEWAYKVSLNDSWDENYGVNATPGGDNIGLSLAQATTVKFYYDHKTHWITDNQGSRIATAPGSYQAALGCGGDWQPDCLLSWLQDPDGDGVATLTVSGLPAGDYEFKVAINEAWDESYGQDGGGDNIAFTVGVGDKVNFAFDVATNTPSVTLEGTLPDDLGNIAQPPVTNPFQDEIMYFVMPDRFANGDATNDTGNLAGDRLINGFDPTDKGFYHGGDLAGLLDKMDYLEDLGVTSIWMTPMFKNNPVQGTGANVSAAYHGYWITDFTQFDPHFGTNAELEAVIDEAHSRGIKVFFDIITNHTADILQYQEDQYSYRNKADFPYRDADGNEFDDRDYVGDPAFPALDAETSFPYTPVFDNAGDEMVKVPAWLNNPIYYHNRGDSQFAGENSLYGDFFGLDDLFTEQPAVVNGMIDIYKDWISDYDIDGFRIDTVKHVNIEFWEEFAAEINKHAKTEGKPDFYIFGEVFSGNPQLLSFYTTRTDMPAVLDFRFYETMRQYVSNGGNAGALADLFAGDDFFTDADSNAYILPTFLGNHDTGRFGYFLKADNGGNQDDAAMLAQSKLAHALMYFARGVPVVYYGDEQGFTGTGGDKDARQDMFPSQVAEYGDAAANGQIGADGTPADDNFDTTHPLYQALTDYAALYSNHKALRSGAQIHRYAADGPGVYAFSRMDRDEQVEYVVAVNNSDSTQDATFPVYGASAAFTRLLGTGGAAALTSDGSNQLTVTVPPMDLVIYQADSPLGGVRAAIAHAAPGIAITTPAGGAEVALGVQELDGNRVPNRLEIAATLDQDNVPAEVTFAIKVNGAGDWQPIGTDTNPPYRVFYDASDLPADATLDIVAVVNDLNGGYAADQVVGVTPTYGDGGATPGGDYDYAVIHYLRTDGDTGQGDYGDHSTGDYNDYWGLHLWGDAIDPVDGTDWTAPKPFLGEDRYGRFAWIKLQDSTKDVNFIVHRGDAKDGTQADRSFNPASDGPEIWIKQDDGDFYTSQAAAQGYATIHYQRDDGAYDGWGLHLWGDAIADGVGTEWSTPRPADGVDEFGAFWNVPIKDANAPLNFIIHSGDDKDPGPDQSIVPANQPHAFILSGDETIYAQQGDAENFVLIHYRRAAGDYGDYTSTDYNDYWGLHTWGAADDPGWSTPRKPAEEDLFGITFKVPLNDKNTDLGHILHRGDTKDPGPDQFLNFGKWGFEVWQLEGADVEKPYILPILKGGLIPGGDLAKSQAHWVDADTIAWDVEVNSAYTYLLHYATAGGITLEDGAVTGADGQVELTYDPAGLADAVKAKFPHLADFSAFKLPGDFDAAAALKGQIVVSVDVPDGAVNASATDFAADATGVQIPGVLDALFTYEGDLGVSWTGDAPTIRLWAPTAKSVKLHIFATATADPAAQIIDMTAGESGTWRATGDASWNGKFYLFEVEVYVPSTGQVERNIVTDPYSLSLSMNSTRSQIVNLDDPTFKPDGWDDLQKPQLAAPEDITLYELHVRDFSAGDATVPDALKGTFSAFTLPDSDGIKHLQALANAGLTHVHLLPSFDIATIDEDKSQWQSPDIPAGATPNGTTQRDAVNAVRDLDGFNWGYDPFHYTVPEGSYATDPDGPARILEFREMVQALNAMGLRVVMDVVYNHTNSSGQAEKSVLDKIVPGYYHRLNADGGVETSTCCQNTATEHAMMEKLMIDSLVTWATAYKVDGFRFDLMGHHMVSDMVEVQRALAAIDPSIFIYGEGWNFGEVADGQRGVNATQFNLAGTGIGTFNDRLRDAVRGGGPFDEGDSIVTNQGFISGVYYAPNASNSGRDAEKAELLLSADQIRVGLAGNLADYEFVDRTGATVKGSEVDYNGSPAGYTQDPQEHIIYVSAHDNETLWDITQFKLAAATTMADRVRVQNLGIDFTVLAQGVPFLHAGVDTLRSKSLDRNSYNSGDWFNYLDWTYETNNWGVGLPPESSANESDLVALLGNPDLAPTRAEIQAANAHVREMLAIRASSPLFRLRTADEIQDRLAFHNTGPDQVPGVIVMSISDKLDGATAAGQTGVGATAMEDLDPARELVVVVFNANDEAQTVTVPGYAGVDIELHGYQLQGSDEAVRDARFDMNTGSFTVPARTTAVFVELVTPTAEETGTEPAAPRLRNPIFLPLIVR